MICNSTCSSLTQGMSNTCIMVLFFLKSVEITRTSISIHTSIKRSISHTMLDLYFLFNVIKHKNQYLSTIKDQECHKADFFVIHWPSAITRAR